MRKRSLIRAVADEPQGLEENISVSEGVGDDTVDDLEEEYEVAEWVEEPEASISRRWIAPTLAITATLAWTAFYGWANRAEMLAGGTPQQWVGWITSWTIPVLLIVGLWLLAVRNSSTEARRFGEVAYTLSAESSRLEERLVTINRELSLAREFLTTQSRELEFLGRAAGERLSEHADRLQSLVRDNGSQVEAIATVSTTALENMDRLRDNLPVISNSAKDVSNQIGNAGRTAQDQLDELIHGFERLNEFGAASERQVASLRKRVDSALEAFEVQANQLGTIAEQRFTALREDSDAFRGDLDSREVEALASIRARFDALRNELSAANSASAEEHGEAIAALQERVNALREEAVTIARTVREGEEGAMDAWGRQVEAMQERLNQSIEEIRVIDESALASANAKLQALFDEATSVDERIAERNRAFDENIGQRRAEIDRAEQDALASMTSRLEALDTEIAERRQAQTAQMELLAREGEELSDRIAKLGTVFATVREQGAEARGELSQGVEQLGSLLADSREALDGTDMAIAAMTDASVRLLELIQASAKHSRDELPMAMEASEARLADIEKRADDVKALLDEAKASGEALTGSMDEAEERARQAILGVDDFQARFGETAAAQVDGIERLRASVAALSQESGAVAERAQGELRDAISALETSAREALAAIETEKAQRIAGIAAKVGEQSADAIDRALSEHTEEAIAKLDAATARSSEAGREVTRQLRDQLAKVNELTGNLESRITHARDRAEEQVNNDFSRRVALITESLNSNAIDIAKALSTEVTDTSWASYLRGDRGIFTRRAVRLVDNTEAREIAELYDVDRDFREHVSRYIHDFEAMLRTVLSTRDGHAVSVTLLSSDMGKLYVVLAQALERLRQ